MRRAPVSLLFVLVLCSCASPPTPPNVDESRKRPANDAAAVELQSCRSELQNTRIAASQSQRMASAAMANAAQIARTSEAASDRNTTYTVLFPYGETAVQMTDGDVARLVDDARTAPLIVLRGRTDGTTASKAEDRVARQRAESVEALLVQAGIEPARIRTTWQPVGDHAADNQLPGGRALNRRVEVEIYRTAPQAPVALVSAAPRVGDRQPVQSSSSEVQHEHRLH
jgi:outer membrane protein OmpA-like peptidoglycan-associated protein